ncbi:hypothetical protein AVEN_229437-1 [Araneus ventricosus]|uniref:Uncharacterized protein n=1 Tax=Araneus ventricosus TaxID=182803 RepID=A0A4Y2P8M3_ARAVE|nr:hypothetical protein AVEN_229437-1 [Araneus ventricosus]
MPNVAPGSDHNPPIHHDLRGISTYFQDLCPGPSLEIFPWTFDHPDRTVKRSSTLSRKGRETEVLSTAPHGAFPSVIWDIDLCIGSPRPGR